MTFSMNKLSTMTFSITKLRIMTLSIDIQTLGIKNTTISIMTRESQ